MRIEISNLRKKFDDQVVLDSFSLCAKKGEIICIKGSSGCGKTTLLRIIAGLDRDFTSDRFNINGNISYLFQENRLMDWKDVFKNISFVVDEIYDENEKRAKITHLLKSVYLFSDQHKYPNELSGGMQRRVALCRSFVYPSEILIMDEPFSGLDTDMKDEISDRFISMIKKKQTVIIVTHDESIMKKCSRIIEL